MQSVDRTCEPDKFLYRCGHQLGFAYESVALRSMGAQIEQGERHCARGCFKPRLHQQKRIRDSVVEAQFLAVDLGGEQNIDEVVTRRLTSTFVDLLAYAKVQLRHRID